MESNLNSNGIFQGDSAFIADLRRFFQKHCGNKMSKAYTIALAGNPDAGKSTVFNALTGMDRHTKSQTGKVPAGAKGTYTYKGMAYTLANLPGTYSLYTHAKDEEITRNFISGGEAKTTIVVCDAKCLERDLNLVLQIMRLNTRMVVCVNFCDEAEANGISIDLPLLSDLLGVPVIGTHTAKNKGMEDLMEAAASMTSFSIRVPWGKIMDHPLSNEEAAGIFLLTEKLIEKVVDTDRKDEPLMKID